MKIIGVIPARYKSSRLPGKPLKQICGRLMIWWVYNQLKKSNRIDEIYVLTDDERIENYCKGENIPVLMTSDNHPDHISRVHQASTIIDADCYVCVNGDEPLLESIYVDETIPNEIEQDIPLYFGATIKLYDAAKVIDFANIKLVLNEKNKCIYMSRNAVPYPRGTLDFCYYKYVGIECYNKAALDFFVNTKMGKAEKIEDIDHLRFIENGVDLYFKEIESESISVDTQKDLDYVRTIMKEKLDSGELKI